VFFIPWRVLPTIPARRILTGSGRLLAASPVHFREIAVFFFANDGARAIGANAASYGSLCATPRSQRHEDDTLPLHHLPAYAPRQSSDRRSRGRDSDDLGSLKDQAWSNKDYSDRTAVEPIEVDGTRKQGSAMQRYFFVLQWTGGEQGDEEGSLWSDDKAATISLCGS
jgi:hypothetical protein